MVLRTAAALLGLLHLSLFVVLASVSEYFVGLPDSYLEILQLGPSLGTCVVEEDCKGLVTPGLSERPISGSSLWIEKSFLAIPRENSFLRG